ncbi:MAG: hypothetical protein ACJ8FS_02565 [Sphingomicrobium sp.]|jgi:hypothetical protein
MSFKHAIALGALTTLCGCNTAHANIGSEDPGMGEAVRYNAAIQAVNPDPVYQAADAQPGDSGAKGAAAVKRYRTDTVKPVESMQTTSSGGSPR